MSLYSRFHYFDDLEYAMSKRRITHQQTARIEKKQARFRDSATEHEQQLLEGLVITRFSRQALIEDADGLLVSCGIRQGIDSLVAGDKVVWHQQARSKQGIIVSRLERSSVLARPDKRHDMRPVAANISQIFIVLASKPEISWSLLDSYLVMAEHLKLDAIIVLNKIDLATDALIGHLQSNYQALGYPIIYTSVHNLDKMQALSSQLKGQSSVFVGQSGVGKSSIIASILPEVTGIQTGAISEKSELGCHTTSNARLYHLKEGGAVIDSPGVREFGLWHMSEYDIAWGYREFRPHISLCKYRNCKHINTPGCAILEAVSQGIIQNNRYQNFLLLVEQFKTQP